MSVFERLADARRTYLFRLALANEVPTSFVWKRLLMAANELQEARAAASAVDVARAASVP